MSKLGCIIISATCKTELDSTRIMTIGSYAYQIRQIVALNDCSEESRHVVQYITIEPNLLYLRAHSTNLAGVDMRQEARPPSQVWSAHLLWLSVSKRYDEVI